MSSLSANFLKHVTYANHHADPVKDGRTEREHPRHRLPFATRKRFCNNSTPIRLRNGSNGLGVSHAQDFRDRPERWTI